MPLVRRRAPARKAGDAFSLASPDASERRAAALACAGDPAMAAPLLATLGAEPVREVRVALVTALASIRTEGAAAGLAGFLGSEDAGLRNDVIEALRRMGGVAEAPLRAVLGDADPDRRLLAVNTLGGAGWDWARACLHRVLAEEPEVNVGLAAVEALASSGLAADAPALTAFAARFPDEPMVAFAVRMALGRLAPAPP